MSNKELCIEILERIYDDSSGEFSFGEDEFLINNLVDDDGALKFTYSNFPNYRKDYSFDSILEVYEGIYDIYKFFRRTGVPKRIWDGLEDYY